MPTDRDPRRPRGHRRLLRSLALTGALVTSAAGSLVAPAVAAADAGTTVVGELVHVVTEGEAGGAAHAAGHADADGSRLSWVQTEEGAVRVPAEQVAGLPTGATVELTVGAPVEDEASEDGYDEAREVLDSDVLAPPPSTAPEPAPAPRGGLTNEVTVVLVAPAGTTPDGTRLRDVVAAVDGSVARFWAEQTGGAITLGVTDSRDWLSTAAGCGDPAAMWDEAAAAVGFVPGAGKHLMLRLSGETANQPACSYALAEVGAGPASGGRLYVRDTSTSVIAHEFGHNFGLGHSSSAQCDGAVETGACRVTGYRDYYDVMGASWAQLGSLNAAQASALRVLPGDAERTVSVGEGATEVTLAPLAGTEGVRALRLVGAEGLAYWLELRSAVGQDAWLGTRDNVYRLDTGVLLHRSGQFPDTSLLLDGSPSAAAGWDADLQAALPVGVAVPLSGGDFTVTVQRMDQAGAVVRVVPAVRAPAAAPAARPASPARGGTIAADRGAEPEVAVAAAAPQAFWAPDIAVSAPRRPMLLEPVADSTSSLGGLLVPVAATALAGATLLLVRHLRRARLIRR
ncbi:reprolysin-like metallopeptidase [Blastococcus montanus]|uniref:reprolysin-like metallopeptidase n=1 Tax=Blastococcus montanus TaxID=3144973 RepID=UPI00320B48F7